MAFRYSDEVYTSVPVMNAVNDFVSSRCQQQLCRNNQQYENQKNPVRKDEQKMTCLNDNEKKQNH